MALITQIKHAVESGDLPQVFTSQILKVWMDSCNIIKSNGDIYAESSINSILANSNLDNSNSTNQNAKLLNSRVNTNGKTEYWFEI
jgi:hypothetical protein